MARFNTTRKKGPTTVNAAGGAAYNQSPELALVSLVLTSFANDAHYKSASEQIDRLGQLIAAVDPLFGAKALVFARDEFGMRSITHAGGALLGKRASGAKWATDFYHALVVRPDDMTETISFALANKLPITNAMKRGFARAFADLTPYQMAKYRGEGKGVKLVDVANLVHPKQSEKNAGALAALMTGDLRSDDTWEAMLSAAGSDGEKKNATWAQLLSEGKLGYMALLRNLRNIAHQAPASLDEALKQLKDPKKVGKARVLPFRYQTAYNELMGQGISRERDILWAIDEAAELALANVPKLEGSTLVALDTSGSMQGGGYGSFGRLGAQRPKASPFQIGSLFAAVLAKVNGADLLTFSDKFAWNQIERMGILPMSRSIKNLNGGTNFNLIFGALKKKYDRIIVLSDGEAWVGPNASVTSRKEYCKQYDATPQVWFFDLANQSGTMQFPEATTRVMAGFSEKIFDLMPLLEQDPHALVNRVKGYEFTKEPTAAAS